MYIHIKQMCYISDILYNLITIFATFAFFFNKNLHQYLTLIWIFLKWCKKRNMIIYMRKIKTLKKVIMWSFIYTKQLKIKWYSTLKFQISIIFFFMLVDKQSYQLLYEIENHLKQSSFCIFEVRLNIFDMIFWNNLG